MRLASKHWCVVILGAILAYQLFVPPVVGLADNGDFSKILGLFRLRAPGVSDNGFVDLTFAFHGDYWYWARVYSSETLPVGLAVALNGIFSKSGRFDLRWVGLVHAGLLVLAFYLIQPWLGRRKLLTVGAILIFGDAVYATYLNSVYMDVATLLFLLLSIAFFLRAQATGRRVDAILLVVCVVLLVTSKPQHVMLGLWAAALLAIAGSVNGRFFAVMSAFVVFCVTCLALTLTPAKYTAQASFSVIFFQVLPHSTDVDGDLATLGLDASYKQYIGKHAFADGAPLDNDAFVREFLRRTSYFRLGRFFITHPRDAWLAIDTSLHEGSRQRPVLGNFSRDAGLWPYAETHAFSLWSTLKSKLFYGHGTRYLIFCVVTAALASALAAAKGRGLPPALMFGTYALAGMAMTELLVASLADAVDVIRHHFIANALNDLLILVSVAWVTKKPFKPRMDTDAHG